MQILEPRNGGCQARTRARKRRSFVLRRSLDPLLICLPYIAAMKTSFLFLVLLVSIAAAADLSAQTPELGKEMPAYNAQLAHRLGADDYGMKKYVIAFLKRGPAKLSGAEAEQLQNAHLKNIIRLADEGKLVLAGPFRDDGEVRGIFILNAETVEEARKLTESDPAVQRGTLQFDLRPWYGSAALMEVLRIHKTLEKKSVAD